MHFTGPYAVDAAWKAFYRLNHGCPARAAAATSAHGGGARDDAGVRRLWQQLHIGTHHWSSLWQVSRLWQPPYPSDAVLEDTRASSAGSASTAAPTALTRRSTTQRAGWALCR